MGYPGPVRRSADYNALVMADILLTGGESSRFHLNLVKGRQSVIQYEANLGWPFAGASDYRDPGMYAMFFLHNPAFDGGQIVAQVEEELARLREQPVEAQELQRARTFLRSARISELQSPLNRARLLAQYEMLDGRPDWIGEELDAFLSVTAPQIRAASSTYLSPEKRAVLSIVPAPPAAGQ
jgi:predicted Zn-dependent peptidase